MEVVFKSGCGTLGSAAVRLIHDEKKISNGPYTNTKVSAGFKMSAVSVCVCPCVVKSTSMRKCRRKGTPYTGVIGRSNTGKTTDQSTDLSFCPG